MINRITLLNELKKYPVFTTRILTNITGSQKKYVNLIIHRLNRGGLIFRIERDKYSVHEDPLISASHIVWPSYISFWTALQYHHLTEQLASEIQILSPRARKNKGLKIGGFTVEFIRTKPEFMFGYGKTYYNGFEIFVASKEKAIADSIVFKRISEDEIIEIIKKHKQEIDLKLLTKYVKKMTRKPWVKRTMELLKRIGKNAESK